MWNQKAEIHTRCRLKATITITTTPTTCNKQVASEEEGTETGCFHKMHGSRIKTKVSKLKVKSVHTVEQIIDNKSWAITFAEPNSGEGCFQSY